MQSTSTKHANMAFPSSFTVNINNQNYRITLSPNPTAVSCAFGETDLEKWNPTTGQVLQTTCTIQPVLIRQQKKKSSIKKELELAIEERDALLELKRQRNIRIATEEKANLARIRSQQKAKELEEAKAELSRLKLRMEKKKQLEEAKAELARLKSLKASMNPDPPPAPRKLPRTCSRTHSRRYSTPVTINQRWMNDGVGLTATVSQNRARRRINFQDDIPIHNYNLRPRN